MKFRNTIILLAILIFLGGYVYFVEVQQHAKKEKIKASEKKVFVFSKDSVKTVKIKNNYGNFVLQKSANEWQITSPIVTGADQSVINGMINSLSNAQKQETFSIAPKEYGDYGLGTRAISVGLILTDGKIDSIRFGDRTPVGAFVFCDEGDTTIFTTNETVKDQFNKKLFDLRDKSILHFQQNDVSEIVLRNPHGTFTFEKEGANDWMIENLKRPADSGKMRSLLSRLNQNRVKAFVDEDGRHLSEYGLKSPQYEVELFLGKDKGKTVLTISRELKGKYYAKDDSRTPIFEIDSTLVKEIDKKVNDFRSTDFANINQGSITKFTVQYDDSLITCVKDTSGNWTMQTPSIEKVQTTKMNQFLSNLNYAVIKDFVKDGKINQAVYGFNNPSLKIDLYQNGNLVYQAVFGKETKDKVYARTNKYDSVYLLDKSKLKQLKLKPAEIVEPVKTEEPAKPAGI